MFNINAKKQIESNKKNNKIQEGVITFILIILIMTKKNRKLAVLSYALTSYYQEILRDFKAENVNIFKIHTLNQLIIENSIDMENIKTLDAINDIFKENKIKPVDIYSVNFDVIIGIIADLKHSKQILLAFGPDNKIYKIIFLNDSNQATSFELEYSGNYTISDLRKLFKHNEIDINEQTRNGVYKIFSKKEAKKQLLNCNQIHINKRTLEFVMDWL